MCTLLLLNYLLQLAIGLPREERLDVEPGDDDDPATCSQIGVATRTDSCTGSLVRGITAGSLCIASRLRIQRA